MRRCCARWAARIPPFPACRGRSSMTITSSAAAVGSRPPPPKSMPPWKRAGGGCSRRLDARIHGSTSRSEQVVSKIRRWHRYFEDCKTAARGSQPFTVSGRLTRVAGLVMEAVGLKLPVGNSCYIVTPSGQQVDAEVVGFSGERLFLMPSTDVFGLNPGALVVPIDPAATRVPQLGEDFTPRRRAEDRAKQVPVGYALLGRVVDGAGRPLDERGRLPPERYVPLYSRPTNPLQRTPIRTVLDVGVRAINSLL